MHPCEQPRYKFIPFLADNIPFASTKCIISPPYSAAQLFSVPNMIYYTHLQDKINRKIHMHMLQWPGKDG